MTLYKLILCFIFINSFSFKNENKPFVVILGEAQDAGYPQIGCKKECCLKFYKGKVSRKTVSCLALVDPVTKQKWIFDATPDFTDQVNRLNELQPGNLSGIFLTHAHIGHYTGLMYLGKEAMNASQVPVYAMPGMQNFLQNNGPWNQLVSLKNISLQKLKADSTIWISDNISVTPLLVPHRDEFSETVGYSIRINNKNILYIPDIDKWQKWDRDIRALVSKYDYLFLDGSFYKEGELPGRNMSEIPHPFVSESMELFNKLSSTEKSRIWFIHFNHTNPLIDTASKEFKEVRNRGFNVAVENQKILF